jgi:type II secretory pathway component PulF
MPAKDTFHRLHRGSTHWAVLAFLAAFAVGIVFLSTYYLLPALEAFTQAQRAGDQTGKKAISATSALLLSVILIILLSGLILTFRVGRFFFPRQSPPRTRTKYVDIWTESGKRMQAPPPEE